MMPACVPEIRTNEKATQGREQSMVVSNATEKKGWS
jgi:hypothetical protein